MARDATDPIVEFWDRFTHCADGLSEIETADDPRYDEILASLHRVDPGLFFEFARAPGGCELIVTADGRRALFPLARAVVAAAPAIRGWTIHALKPRLGFPVTTRWETFTVRIADVSFEPLERAGSDELGLRLHVPDLEVTDVSLALSALLRALDHGLGEEAFAEAVSHVEVRPLPGGASADEFIPLLELPAYLEWRRRG